MPDFSYGQVQQTSQVQRQVLSQKQIQSLKLLAMSGEDLNAEIRKAVNENPALEIARDTAAAASADASRASLPYDNTRTSYTSAAGNEAAQKFQDAYENAADTRETLQEHLLFQLNVMKLSPDEKSLGKALIENLNENGWHILAPASLLDKSRPAQNTAMLDKMLHIIRCMDPEGTCCNDMEESLYVQAQIAGDAPPLALFILDGHIDVLYSNDATPDIERIKRKIIKLQEASKRESFGGERAIDSLAITSADVENAIAFISRLNPHPAQGYGKAPTHYISPDISVTETTGEAPSSFGENEMFVENTHEKYFRITLAKGAIPSVRIVPGFNAQRHKELKKNLKAAEQFLDNLAYRKSLLLQSCEIIVKTQIGFFSSHGKGYLEELTQSETARILGVNESTVSRMANEKFMQTPWGQLFPLKYFFTNSQDKVKFALRQLIENRASGKKPLSDRELVEKLAAQGIHVARRTVAKYRTQLAIGSSYTRGKTPNP